MMQMAWNGSAKQIERVEEPSSANDLGDRFVGDNVALRVLATSAMQDVLGLYRSSRGLVARLTYDVCNKVVLDVTELRCVTVRVHTSTSDPPTQPLNTSPSYLHPLFSIAYIWHRKELELTMRSFLAVPVFAAALSTALQLPHIPSAQDALNTAEALLQAHRPSAAADMVLSPASDFTLASIPGDEHVTITSAHYPVSDTDRAVARAPAYQISNIGSGSSPPRVGVTQLCGRTLDTSMSATARTSSSTSLRAAINRPRTQS